MKPALNRPELTQKVAEAEKGEAASFDARGFFTVVMIHTEVVCLFIRLWLFLSFRLPANIGQFFAQSRLCIYRQT